MCNSADESLVDADFFASHVVLHTRWQVLAARCAASSSPAQGQPSVVVADYADVPALRRVQLPKVSTPLNSADIHAHAGVAQDLRFTSLLPLPAPDFASPTIDLRASSPLMPWTDLRCSLAVRASHSACC